MRRTFAITAAAAAALATSACTSSDDPTGSGTATTTLRSTVSPNSSTVATVVSSQPSGATAATTASTVPTTASATPASHTADTDETIVRFTSGDGYVDVTIEADNATTRDFLSMLPLTLRFEDFNGREKISYLPRALDTNGASGSDPEDGDLIYYTPWGNLGFYYNTAGIGYSDQVIHLGTYNASLDELTLLERGDVTVNVVE